MSQVVVGISAYYHDSAACVIVDGEVVAAAEEERFTRKKHDSSFPHNALRYCIAEAGLTSQRVDAVAFYDKPILKFHRIMESFLCVAPRGLRSFARVVPNWLRHKLWTPVHIAQALEECGIQEYGQLYFTEHHESHAASAFYPSPFEEAAVLTIDGVGEWACTTVGHGHGTSLALLEEARFPHSLGLLYSAFTYYTGFKVNSGEYKLMGLAPYGRNLYEDLILDNLLDLKEDGSFRLDMRYFKFVEEQVMIGEAFEALFGKPARQPESAITQHEMDIARSVQAVTEKIVLRMAKHARELTGSRNLCMAGGVALNCVANGKLIEAGIFDNVWIQPAAGDSGGSLGAAFAVLHNELGGARVVAEPGADKMHGSLLGPHFSNAQIKAYLDDQEIPYTELASADRPATVAQLVADQKIVGLFNGRMEFGPRALGNRSIIADPRSGKMQLSLNQKIKFRESFRPFAASVLKDRQADYFQLDSDSPYMLVVAKVNDALQLAPDGDEGGAEDGAEDGAVDIMQWAAQERSTIPAVTHVDYSCRIQSVAPASNEPYSAVLSAFEALTGEGILINTSFNVRGEPIVCTPSDAYSCFMRTHLDFLVMGDFLLDKTQQRGAVTEETWGAAVALD